MATLDIYTTRTMLPMLEQLFAVRTFFLNRFFKVAPAVSTATIEIDIMKGKRRMAPIVNPRVQGKIVERLGYKTFTYAPPYVKPKRVITAQDSIRRAPGEVLYGSNVDPQQRALDLLARDLNELDGLISRREEWMAAQALTTGKLLVNGDGVRDTIDFQMPTTHLPALTSTRKWSASASATPINDLVDWCNLVAQDSGVVPNTCVMGLSAYKAFRDVFLAAKAPNPLSPINITLGKIDPRVMPDGTTYVGSINESGVALDVFTYQDWYVDDIDGSEYAMMPVNKVLIGSTNARAELHHAVIQDMDAIEGGLAAVPRFPKSWTERDPGQRVLMVQSAPLAVPHQIDAFLCATVL